MQPLRDLEDIRANLTQKLEEIQRRANQAADLAQAAVHYWQHPAVRFGIGVVLGLALGGGRRRSDGGDSEGLLRAIVRAGLMAATSSMVTRALAPQSLDAAEGTELPPLPDNDHRYEVIR
jgi:hypothetical protein